MSLYLLINGTITTEGVGGVSEVLTNRDYLNALEVAHLMEYRNNVMRSMQTAREVEELERLYALSQVEARKRVELPREIVLNVDPPGFIRGLVFGMIFVGLIAGATLIARDVVRILR